MFIFRAFLAIFDIARYQEMLRGNTEMFPPGFPKRGVYHMKLTAANVELPEGKHDTIFLDDVLKGFGLRVRRLSNRRITHNWIIQYRQHGHQRRMIIGSGDKLTATQARAKARKLLAEVELGGDPQADRRERREKDTKSFRFVISHEENREEEDQGGFLENKSAVKESTKRMLANYLLGPLGKRAQKQGMKPYLKALHPMPIDKITRADISARILAASKSSGEPTAIALRSALNSLFSWAMRMGLVEANPVIEAISPPKQETRDRVLIEAELAAIWKALLDDDYGKVIKLLVLTGCRREEIGGMRWSEFNFHHGTWTLPAARSKNTKAHTLPLTSLMLDVLDTIPHRDGVDLLFGRKHGFTGWSIGKRMMDERLGLPAWTHHDIRRSAATHMANIGIQPHIIEEILNHQSGHRRGVAGIYNRSPYEREVRAALALWSDHVRALVEGSERKIVPLQRQVS